MGVLPARRRPQAFLLDVDLLVRVRLQVVQTLGLAVHDLIRGFHEPAGSRKEGFQQAELQDWKSSSRKRT